MNVVFNDSPYQAVLFTMEVNGNHLECLGFIYTTMLEEFNKPDTTSTKRMFMCNVVINNRTGTIMKNAYEGRHL